MHEWGMSDIRPPQPWQKATACLFAQNFDFAHLMLLAHVHLAVIYPYQNLTEVSAEKHPEQATQHGGSAG